ncbi:MAG: ECF-type sigma factor [Gemmataceae bacterium]
MSEHGSITLLVQQLKAGQRDALQDLWARYFERLVRLARKKLDGAPRQMADEEDVALSAINSFCVAVENQRFPKLEDSADLWQILVMLVRKKSARLWEYHSRERRNHNKVQSIEVPPGAGSESDAFFLDQIQGETPDPQVAAEFTEQLQVLLQTLSDKELQQIAVLRLEGHTHGEIGETIDRSSETVRRRLERIQKTWVRLFQEGSE